MDKNTYNMKRLRNRFLKSYYSNDLKTAQKEGENLIAAYKNTFDQGLDMEAYREDLFNLACVYDKNGIYARAAELYRRAADAEERLNGKSERLSDIYNNLGAVHASMRQPDTALAYFKKCYNIRKSCSDTQSLIEVCYNLGSVYKLLHRYSDSARYYAAALNLREKKNLAYGDNLYNLGLCYVEAGELALGLGYMSKALPIYKAAEGNPQEYISALCMYASTLYRGGKYQEAIEGYNSLITAIKESYGISRPFYANMLSRLADCYVKTDNAEKGIMLKRKALNIVKKSLGTNHIFYASCLSELGEVYVQLGDIAKAALLYSEALEIRGKILGMENQECIGYIHILANIYSKMRLYKKAEDMLNYALTNISEKNKGYMGVLLELIKLYMETENGAGLNRAFMLFNKIHPEKGFDEMLDMAEDAN